MMLARKWDRIENITKSANYDIFAVAKENTGEILDDIADLRAYLLLVESHVKTLNKPSTLGGRAASINFSSSVGGVATSQNEVYQRHRSEARLYTPGSPGVLGEPTSAYVNQG